jgi:hypothetical protein
MTSSSHLDLKRDERVAIVDLADDLQIRKQTIFKFVKREGIIPQEMREPMRGNQKIKTVSQTEAQVIRDKFKRSNVIESQKRLSETCDAETIDVFYLIQLEPDHDPGRVKLGFGDVNARLQKYRSSSPSARIVKTWPCRSTWERAATDYVAKGSEQVRSEVYRVSSIEDLVRRGDSFFTFMPKARENSCQK